MYVKTEYKELATPFSIITVPLLTVTSIILISESESEIL